MKKILSAFVLIFFAVLPSFAQENKTALLLIDIQNFYFEGGRSELVEPVKAAENAAKLLAEFRKEGKLVVHVRHNSEPGGEIHKLVEPLPGEKIVSKSAVNCFVGTDLLDFLKSEKVGTLVICGMQTHMCVEAATRAAADFGFICFLIGDACATKDVKYGDKVIKAEDVHYSTLGTMRSYAKVESTEEFLSRTSGRPVL
jgi:nicotinamidase-related amidase